MSSKSRRPIAIRALLALSLVLGVLVVSGGTPASATGANVDLGVTLTQGSGHATAGLPWAYSIKVANAPGVDNSTGYTVSLDVPSGTTTGTLGAGCTDSGPTVDCVSTGLASGSNETFNVSLNVGSDFANGGTLATTAKITDVNGDTDASTEDDSSPVSTTVDTVADLEMTAGTPTYPGTQTAAWANTDSDQNFVIYEFTLTNNGPSDAQGVQVTNTLDADMTLVGACWATTTGCTPNETFPLNIGTLKGSPTNESVYVRVEATADDSLRNGPLTESDSPSASTSTTDSNSENDSASEDATVWTVPSTPTDPDARPGDRTNAYFLWKEADVSSTNGGSAIDTFHVTVTGSSAPPAFDVGVGDSCGTNGNKQVFCTNVTSLTENSTYDFVVSAHNDVGLSDPTSAVSATPTKDASAAQIGNSGGLSQNTGNGNPSKTDPQTTAQTFQPGTTGVGTILESNQGQATFCDAATGPDNCTLGQMVRTKLLDHNSVVAAYTITLLYDKTLVGGTGQKYSFFYAASDSATTGQVLPTCPKTIKTSSLPCVQIKLGSGGANPALKAIVHTLNPDPTIGGRAYPK